MAENPDRMPEPSGNPWPRVIADVMTFGWVLPASIASGAGLGWLADKLLGTFPVGTVAVGLVGLAAGILQIYREASKLAEGPAEGPPKDGPQTPP